jgi:hypothetical protein
MPKTKKDSAALQTKRRRMIEDAGKNQKVIAAEIAAADGKTCSRQAVEALIKDRMPPSRRMVEGFCKAVGYNKHPRYLFPGYTRTER